MNKKRIYKPRPPKKRRRKGDYYTGFHKSKKALTEVHYRSGWEKAVCLYLDLLTTVSSYAYEAIAIPYIANKRTGKIRHYFPDFLVMFTDGTKKLIEVKRKDKINTDKVKKKTEAAMSWCEKNNAIFEIWSDDRINVIKKLLSSGK
jgi:antitoxin component YwqK of YwqJK toxin-antitoxin module